MTKAILWNAPRLAGKDFAIEYLKSVGIPLVVREAKDQLHLLTRQLFCLSEERYWQIYNDRSLKEVPLPEFGVQLDEVELKYLASILGINLTLKATKTVGFDLSIRQAMIYVSEVICKPRFGSNYFGAARAKSIKEGEIIVDGSCGFEEELPPLINRLGQENILLIRVHRNGCTFDGDSRNWIADGVVHNTVDVYNNGMPEWYLSQIENIVKDFINN